MKQATRTFLLPLRNVDDAFRKALRDIGDEVQAGLKRQQLPKRHAIFENVATLHYFSCSILEANDGHPPLLVIELSFDGSVHECLRELLEKQRAVMHQILAHWEEYPGQDAPPDQVIAKLEPRGRHANAVYIGTPGRSVAQIHEEEGLRSAMLEALESDASARPRGERWKDAVTEVLKPRPASYRFAPPRPRRVRFNVAANPIVRARLREAVRLATLAALLVAGACGAVYFGLAHERESWHEMALLIVPLSVAGLSLVLRLAHAPRGLTLRAQLGVAGEGLVDFVTTALWLAVVGGLVVAAFEADWERSEAVTSLLWGASVTLGALQVLVVAAYLYVVRSARAAGVGAALTLGLLAVLFFRTPLDIEPIFGLVALVYVATLAFVGLRIWGFARALRRREGEREHWDQDEDLAHLDVVTRREHQQVQSHLVSQTWIQEGRMGTLTGVLRVVQFFATWFFNLGHLATIPSIHFARFMVLPERNTLLFFSNYDDRFDTYLGDFSDVVGVTAVWGNTHRFPQPFLLVLDGARQENLFKRFARDSQRESLIWYSAYPNLTVGEIDRASRLRDALGRPIDVGGTGLLADLKRWWRRPLDEAALEVLMEGR